MSQVIGVMSMCRCILDYMAGNFMQLQWNYNVYIIMESCGDCGSQ